jgi:hypothetical protein
VERRAAPVVYSVDVEPIELWKEGRMYKPILVYRHHRIDVESVDVHEVPTQCAQCEVRRSDLRSQISDLRSQCETFDVPGYT